MCYYQKKFLSHFNIFHEKKSTQTNFKRNNLDLECLRLVIGAYFCVDVRLSSCDQIPISLWLRCWWLTLPCELSTITPNGARQMKFTILMGDFCENSIKSDVCGSCFSSSRRRQITFAFVIRTFSKTRLQVRSACGDQIALRALVSPMVYPRADAVFPDFLFCYFKRLQIFRFSDFFWFSSASNFSDLRLC